MKQAKEFIKGLSDKQIISSFDDLYALHYGADGVLPDGKVGEIARIIHQEIKVYDIKMASDLILWEIAERFKKQNEIK